jgi:hypothetical protein
MRPSGQVRVKQNRAIHRLSLHLRRMDGLEGGCRSPKPDRGPKGERIAQGRENACQWMQENPKAAEEVRTLLVERRKAENTAPASEFASNGAPSAAAA